MAAISAAHDPENGSSNHCEEPLRPQLACLTHCSPSYPDASQIKVLEFAIVVTLRFVDKTIGRATKTGACGIRRPRMRSIVDVL